VGTGVSVEVADGVGVDCILEMMGRLACACDGRVGANVLSPTKIGRETTSVAVGVAVSVGVAVATVVGVGLVCRVGEGLVGVT
jgi:hypothetical protein